MSFLDSGKNRFNWAAAARSVRRDPGCSQCGRTLEMNAAGKFDLSGKCQGCVNPMVDEFQDFDELED